jgi:anti-sigma B factor antagonist
MEIVVHTSKDYDVFIIKGEIKISTLVTVSSMLSKHLEKNIYKDLVIDLSQVEYIDSSGLRMLINLQKKLEVSNKKPYLLNPSAQTAKLLDETKTDKVFTVIHSTDELDQQIAANIYQKYLPYTIEQSNLLRLRLSCAVCGSENVVGYLFDLNNYVWSWKNDDPYPNAHIGGNTASLDILGHIPVICLECSMCSINLNDFNVLDNEAIAIKSSMGDTVKLLLSKTIKKRKKMIQGDTVIGDTMFEYPRNKTACYIVYSLAEFCARTISVNKGSSSPYIVGYLNYLCLRYAKIEEKTELINSCRTWFTQALNQIDKLNEREIAISYMAILLAGINLEKYDECHKLSDEIKFRQQNLPAGQSTATYSSPGFWYEQALNIWHIELESKSRILR